MIRSKFKYLTSSDKDTKWGITVDNIGKSSVPAGYDVYPPNVGHPGNYYFDTDKGRTLDNYHLIYISSGKGTYYTSPGAGIPVMAGDMFLLRPGVWHSYLPDPGTGWDEYWIGLRGPNIDARFRNGFFDPKQVVFKVGYRDDIVHLYERAMDVAFKEHVSYQQVLAGIANLLLGLTMYYDGNRQFADDSIRLKIDRARALMREMLLQGIKPEEVAAQVEMSYSWFRRAFKEYTGLSPSHYQTQLLMQEARSMLLNTTMSIKEIAYSLNYADPAHFSSRFRKDIGLTPLEFRTKFSY